MSGQGEEGGFLERWSRRKREATDAGIADDTPQVAEPAVVPPASTVDREESAAMSAESAAVAPESKEDPHVTFSLPRLDELTAETNIALFMQRGVPDAIRNAALRKMWALVPAIRDFRTPAEYDFDWNTPGGAPGYGPLTESDNVAEMIERILGHRKSPEERARESAAAAQESTEVTTDPALDAPMSVLNRTDREAPVNVATRQDEPSAPAAPSDPVRLLSREVAPAEAESASALPGEQAGDIMLQREDPGVRPLPWRRRHGGAAPV